MDEIGEHIVINHDQIILTATPYKKNITVKTEPYPGFPTDLQAPLMALLSQAHGESLLEETVYLERFSHVQQFQKMGMKIHVDHSRATIEGGHPLIARELEASDLRGAAALLAIALGTPGETFLKNTFYLHRGYADLNTNLLKLGACIDVET